MTMSVARQLLDRVIQPLNWVDNVAAWADSLTHYQADLAALETHFIDVLH